MEKGKHLAVIIVAPTECAAGGIDGTRVPHSDACTCNVGQERLRGSGKREKDEAHNNHALESAGSAAAGTGICKHAGPRRQKRRLFFVNLRLSDLAPSLIRLGAVPGSGGQPSAADHDAASRGFEVYTRPHTRVSAACTRVP